MTFDQLDFGALSGGLASDAPPPGLRYLPEAISPETERSLLEAIDAHPWLTSMSRRVQHHGWKYDYKARRVRRDSYIGPLPAFLTPLIRLVRAEADFTPEQAIINEYEPGQGIAPHIDCEPCFGPVIVMVGLGSSTQMDFAHQTLGRTWSLRFDRRAMLILGEDARSKWTHSIPKRRTDAGGSRRRGRRVSVTLRTVLPDTSQQLG
jgi:alkylated DNA repair dioxygenase AlkB